MESPAVLLKYSLDDRFLWAFAFALPWSLITRDATFCFERGTNRID